MTSDFSLFFLKHFHLILSKAFSLRVIPCSHKQPEDVRKVTAFSGQTQEGEQVPPAPHTAEARKRLLDMHAWVTNITVFQFSSAYRNTKTQIGTATRARLHTHIYTRRKLGSADKFNLHAWTTLGLCRCAPSPRSPSRAPGSLPHNSTLCNIDANGNSRAAPGVRRENR